MAEPGCKLRQPESRSWIHCLSTAASQEQGWSYVCGQFKGLTGTWEVITESMLENVYQMTINPYVKSLSCRSYGRLQTRRHTIRTGK